jgi:hypothetical protein
MFNLFLHEKQSSQAASAALSHQQYLKSISAQLKLRNKLALSNRFRVQNRILQMSLSPVPIAHKDYSILIPDLKGERFFRHRPKNSQERVRDAEISNTWLDPVPLHQPQHDFRPRNKEKEIHSSMKFRPRDRYERVAETWLTQQGTVNSTWEVNERRTEKCVRFPNKLRKSYYKTVESVALNFTLGREGKVVGDVKKETEEIGLEALGDRKLAEVAQEVMEKCKLKPLKSELSYLQSRSSSLPVQSRVN